MNSNLSIEGVVHDTLREVLQQISDNCGIRVESVSVDWREFGTIDKPRSVIREVKVISATTNGS